MDSRQLLGLAVSVGFGFLRWRFPAIPRPIATFGSIIGFGLLGWSIYPQVSWYLATFIILLFALLVCCLEARIFRKVDIPSAPKESKNETKFIKIADNSIADIEDSYSSADIAFDVQASKITARGFRHEPPSK